MHTAYADLEISLHRGDSPGRYRIEAALHLPGSTAESGTEPRQASLDLDALGAIASDPVAYGQSLSAFLFAEAPIRDSFIAARAAAAQASARLRVRLKIGPGATELHALRWETLADPASPSAFLAMDENVLFSRYLSSPDMRPVYRRPRGELKAVVVVANPADGERWRLAPVDVAGELARAREALGDMPITAICSGEGLGCQSRPTLENIIARLREGCDILYLACHGRLIDETPWLYLEDPTGNADIVPGDQATIRGSPRIGLAGQLHQLPQEGALPRLVVLASCQSAGEGGEWASSNGSALSSLGARLAEAGVPAVVAMQGEVSMATVAWFMPVFFRELMRDGQIDRAMAAARREAQSQGDWWAPALFTRLEDGLLFGLEELSPEQSAALFTRLFELPREVPAAREVLIGGKEILVGTRQQIRLLTEYKGVHDLLQQLELSYRVVYDLTYQDNDLLPAERVSWRGLSSSQNALQTTIGKVCDFVATVSFTADADEWACTLQTARGQLRAAYERRDIEDLGAAVTDVAYVVGRQTSRMNDRLIDVLDALGLEHLIEVLRRAQEEMARVPVGTNATLPRRLERFAEDLAGLEGMAARLKALRDEHDAWQQADNDLRSEQDLLGLSLDRFRRRWERLARKLRALCETANAPWACDLASAIARMETALGPNAAADPMDAFSDCRSAVIQRFNQVDQDLKTLCDLLKEAGGPLDTMLDGLA